MKNMLPVFLLPFVLINPAKADAIKLVDLDNPGGQDISIVEHDHKELRIPNFLNLHGNLSSGNLNDKIDQIKITAGRSLGSASANPDWFMDLAIVVYEHTFFNGDHRTFHPKRDGIVVIDLSTHGFDNGISSMKVINLANQNGIIETR